MAHSETQAWGTTVDPDEHALWFFKKNGENEGAFTLTEEFNSFIRWEDHP